MISNLQNIHDDWGVVWSPTKEELLSVDPMEFRQLHYDRGLVIIKSVGDLTESEVYSIADRVGNPWKLLDYVGSNEKYFHRTHDGQSMFITKFNTSARRIGNEEMSWHADIPHNLENPFPFRLLYLSKKPSNDSGKTKWLNIELDKLNLSEQQLKYFSECEVTQQSWHKPGKDPRRYSFIKSHSIYPERKSLRLNYFRTSDGRHPDAWIKESWHNGKLIPNEVLIGDTTTELLKRPELQYVHTWTLGDIAIYDNHSFIHGRTALEIPKGEEREFIRINIDHVAESSFNNKEFFKL